MATGSDNDDMVILEVPKKAKVAKYNPLEGVIPAPEMSDSDDEDENDVMTSSSEEDPEAKVNYKNTAYW